MCKKKLKTKYGNYGRRFLNDTAKLKTISNFGNDFVLFVTTIGNKTYKTGCKNKINH